MPATAIAENYRGVIAAVEHAVKDCGRNPGGVTVIAVSKGHPVEAIGEAYTAGCREFGENRVQEALKKIPVSAADANWHLIGTLQRNKVKAVIGKFALIHSIESVKLAKEVSRRSVDAGVNTKILLQVNCSGEATKHGATPENWRRHFEEVLALPNIEVQGLMTIAPMIEEGEVIRYCFRTLRSLRDYFQSKYSDRVHLPHLSMGMSHDYRIAIEEGATLLRMGTAIFGTA